VATGKNQRRRLASSIAVVLSIFLVSCADDPESYVGPRPEVPQAQAEGASPSTEGDPEREVTLSWTGCGVSKTAYMTEAAAAYKAKRGVAIIVTGGGATRGIRATAGGLSDIGGTCRCCLPDSSDQEDGALLTHVGWDALVFFTHRDSSVKTITLDQAKAVLLGGISNWSELGGPDERIIRIFRRQTREGKLSGVGYMTRLLVFGDPEIDFTTDALFERSSDPVERFVERTEHSFAVTGVSSARKRDVHILELDGIAPSKENIANGTYKLFRPLYLVTRGEPTGPVKDFLDWIVGPEGQAVLSAAGTVNRREGKALEPLFRHWPGKPGLVRNH
jgi:phosphate transport system substrate-binding protein